MQVSSKLKSLLQFYKKDIHLMKIKSKKHTLHITGASCLGSIFIGTGKMVMGILSMSFFTCASALYTYAIVIAKGYVVYGISQSQNNIAEQYEYYKRAGKLLVVAGTAYIIYSIKLYFYPTISHFDLNMALGIASFTFVELGFNIRGIIVERKNKMPLFHALKIVNLASSCICLVLTQTALLAYTSIETGMQHNSSSNGMLGILMGGLSTLLGIYLILRADRIVEGKDSKSICKKIEKIMRKERLVFSFQPIQIRIKEDGKRILVIELKDVIDDKARKQLYDIVLNKMNLVMMDKHDTIEYREAIQ